MKQSIINALKVDDLKKLSNKERKDNVTYLKEECGMSYREIEKETGVPHTTQHHWVMGRKDNDINNLIRNFCTKLQQATAEEITDWGKLELIKQYIEELIIKK